MTSQFAVPSCHSVLGRRVLHRVIGVVLVGLRCPGSCCARCRPRSWPSTASARDPARRADRYRHDHPSPVSRGNPSEDRQQYQMLRPASSTAGWDRRVETADAFCTSPNLLRVGSGRAARCCPGRWSRRSPGPRHLLREELHRVVGGHDADLRRRTGLLSGLWRCSPRSNAPAATASRGCACSVSR